MKVYKINTIQKLPTTKQEIWDFLSLPENIIKVMPSNLNFMVEHGGDLPIHIGQIIQYSVTPLKGFTTKWVSEITEVVNQDYFVDIQIDGPYKSWHHTHIIREIENGVEVVDIIEYELPYGFIGKLLHPFIIKPKLNQIFNYRKEKMEHLFGSL